MGKMIMNKILKKFNIRGAEQGLTLVEVVVSMALLAIISLAIATAMAQALTFLSATHKRTAGGMSAAASVEAKHDTDTPQYGSDSITIYYGTSSATVYGSYVSGSENGVKYHEFVPN